MDERKFAYKLGADIGLKAKQLGIEFAASADLEGLISGSIKRSAKTESKSFSLKAILVGGGTPFISMFGYGKKCPDLQEAYFIVKSTADSDMILNIDMLQNIANRNPDKLKMGERYSGFIHTKCASGYRTVVNYLMENIPGRSSAVAWLTATEIVKLDSLADFLNR